MHKSIVKKYRSFIILKTRLEISIKKISKLIIK